MEFSPAFALLVKFSIGLPPTSNSEDDVLAVSKYLGIDLPEASLDARITILSSELSAQDGFLSNELDSDSIYWSDEYRKSMFVREVVANNRINRQNSIDRRRGKDGSISSIVLKKSAVDKLIENLQHRRSTSNTPGSDVPLLSYYQSGSATQRDRTTIEHGDGFMLSFVSPADIEKADEIAYRSVPLGNGRAILIGGPVSVLSTSFNVGFSDGKFTLDHQISA